MAKPKPTKAYLIKLPLRSARELERIADLQGRKPGPMGAILLEEEMDRKAAAKREARKRFA